MIGSTRQQLFLLDYHLTNLLNASTRRPSSAAEFLLLYTLATMVNSKVHSLERTRRCSGLRAVTVLQWRRKLYQVNGV